MERKNHIDTHGDESCSAYFPESRSLGVFMYTLLETQVYDFKQGTFYQFFIQNFLYFIKMIFSKALLLRNKKF